MLTQTVPARSARAIRWASAPSRVKTPAARPNGVSFATATASSAESTSITATAGPKISSRFTRMAFVVPVKMVGSTKCPSGYPSTLAGPPPTAASAPSAFADS
jgi:hypothetical protein